MVFGGGWGARRRGPGWGPGYGRGPWGPPPPGYGRGYGGGGNSCLRDLLFLDAGCCVAELLGCGPQLLFVLLAPGNLRRMRGAEATGRVAGRLIAAVRVYRREISPRRRPCCRFSPTCSTYAIEALERHGAVRGSWLVLRRLLRCHPWAVGGTDPVPAAA